MLFDLWPVAAAASSPDCEHPCSFPTALCSVPVINSSAHSRGLHSSNASPSAEKFAPQNSVSEKSGIFLHSCPFVLIMSVNKHNKKQERLWRPGLSVASHLSHLSYLSHLYPKPVCAWPGSAQSHLRVCADAVTVDEMRLQLICFPHTVRVAKY